jgi:hypothetical protein
MPQPAPVKINLRLPADLAEALRLQAATADRSINSFIVQALRQAVGPAAPRRVSPPPAAPRVPAPTARLAAVPRSEARAAAEKAGRNAPCPCGSGRKSKHCCLA